MTKKSKTFQDFINYESLKLQAWYGTKDIESTSAFYLYEESQKYLGLKSYHGRRLALKAQIEARKKSPVFRKAFGDAASCTQPRPAIPLVYYALDCFDSIRERNPAATPPNKGTLRRAVEKVIGRSVTAKQWEIALANARLSMLSEDKPGRPKSKLATKKVTPRR